MKRYRESLNDPAELTLLAENIYYKLGKLLTLSSRFESNCSAICTLLNLKRNRKSKYLFEKQDELQKFVDQLRKTLSTKINWIIDSKHREHSGIFDIYKILDNARESRNYVVHEMTIGLFEDVDLNPIVNDVKQEIKKHAKILSFAITITEYMIARVNNEEIYGKWLSDYRKKLIDWVDKDLE